MGNVKKAAGCLAVAAVPGMSGNKEWTKEREQSEAENFFGHNSSQAFLPEKPQMVSRRSLNSHAETVEGTWSTAEASQETDALSAYSSSRAGDAPSVGPNSVGPQSVCSRLPAVPEAEC